MVILKVHQLPSILLQLDNHELIEMNYQTTLLYRVMY